MLRLTVLSTVRAVSAGGVFLLGCALSAHADWSDNFDGDLQAPWQFGSLTGVGGPSGTFAAGSVNNQLQLADSTPAAAGGAAAGFGIVPDFLDDQRVTGILNPNGDAAVSATLALLARGDVASSQFYAAEINYASGDLIIFRSDGPGSTINLTTGPIAGLTRAASVYVEFDLVGDVLAARAYDVPNGALLQSVATTDATYTVGLSGVLVSVSEFTQPALGVWDDVSATTIPEPTTAALMIAAFGGALAYRRRRGSQ